MNFKITIFTFLLASFFLNAQKINAGANLGLPIGEISNRHGINLGIDASLLLDMDKKTEVGFTTGLNYLFGKSLEINNSKLSTKGVFYIPFAATVDYHLYDQFYAGLDVGVGLILRNVDSFKFYLQPKFGVKINEDLKAYSSVKIIDGGAIVGFGFNYSILK